MEEEEGNNRRLLLATALCMGVYVVWQTVFPPPPLVEPETPAEVATAATTSTGTAVSSISSAGSSTVARASTPEVDVEFFDFEGSVATDSGPVAFTVKFTNVGGAFEGFTLPGFAEKGSEDGTPVSLVDAVSSAPPAEVAFGQMAAVGFEGASSFEFPDKPIYEVVEKRADFIHYRFATKDGIQVDRRYNLASDDFAIGFTVTITNRSGAPSVHQLNLSSATRTNDATRQKEGWFSFMSVTADHLEALCFADGSVQREVITSLKDGDVERFEGDLRWIGIDRQYFLAGLVARDEDKSGAACRLDAKGETARSTMIFPPVTLQPGASRTHTFTAFLGVKKPALLAAVEPELDRAINYTVLGLNFAPLCEALLWILRFIHDFTGSWGLAIIGLTVLAKVLLFPLNQRQGKSMRAMSALRPELDKIKEKFPDDRQRQGEETMRLYKEHNVNPTAGCLPILVQMPIWFSLYRALWVSTDLYQEDFLWISDLTSRDPYWILPLSLMAVMFIQQKMMPAAMDPQQQKIMTYTMPLMFGFFMSALPAGLCLYMLVNTLLTILQQHLINRQLGPPNPGRPAAAPSGA